MDYLIDDLNEPILVSDQVFAINVLISILFGIWIYVLCNDCTYSIFAYGISIILSMWLIGIAYIVKNMKDDDRLL